MSELWLKFKDDDGYDLRVKVDRDEFTVGRHSSNSLCIPNSRLSREHIRIEKSGNEYVVSDSGSTNGTRINGDDLRGEVVVNSGDKLDLGGGVEILAELISTEQGAASFADDLGGPTSEGSFAEVPEVGGESASTPPPSFVPTAPSSDSGIPTSVFYIAPILGLLILILLGGLIYFMAGPTRPSGNDIAYSSPTDGENDHPPNKHVDDPPPTNVTGPGKTPENLPPVNNGPTGNDDPPPTPPANVPTTDSAKCERSAAAFLRRIAQNEPKAFLTGEQAQIVSGVVKQMGSSSAIADNINSARRNSAQIKALAVSKNIKPQLLATAALAKLGTSRGDALQAAQGMVDTLDKLSTQIGSELANDSLLLIAAYDQGANGNFMGMRNMLQDLATKSTDSAREIRTIWFLHKNGKITDGEYDFALRFLAIGIITQSPKDFGVNAEPLAL